MLLTTESLTALCRSLIPSDGPVKAAGADKGSVCCSTGARSKSGPFIPAKPSKSEVERETGALHQSALIR